ncbi:MAG: phosphatase PAP2 family protein [Pseudomonadota bacterium]
MYSRFSLKLFLACLILFGQAAHADSERRYLPKGSVDIKALVEPPPAQGSAAFEAEMAVVLWMQRTRTEAQIEFVQRTLNVDTFAPFLGSKLFAVDAALLKSTIDDVIDEVRSEYDALKESYDVPRPFQVNPEVKPVTEWRAVKSFPSGHSVRAIIYARLLGEVFPESRDDMVAHAMQIGYGRVLAGVHFPGDVLAGQQLGHAFADVILRQDAFRSALTKVGHPQG